MKIAYVIPSLRKVGPNVVVLSLVNELVRNNKDVVVYYLDGVGDVAFPCPTKQLKLGNIKELYQYDIIHSHMLRPDAILSLLPFYKGKKITTIHNIVETDIFYTHGRAAAFFISKLWVSLWKGFSSYIVLSEVARHYYLRLGLNEKKINVIYNGVSPIVEKSLSPEDKDILIDIKKRGKILGTACLFNRRKGLDQVISALPRLPQCHFVIVGEGPERDSLEELAENLGVSDRVHFLGFRNDPAPLFKYFDIYMMPSREEGFGLALSEAILHGVPAVCSDIPIFRETFTSNEVSFFEIESTSSLVSAVIVALENHDSLSNLGSEKVKSHYLQSIMLKNHLSLYRK